MMNSWELNTIFAVIAIMLAITATSAANTCTDSQLLRGPIIEPCLSEMILENGKNYTITCKGKLPVEFKQQEIPEDVSYNFTQRHVTIEEGEYRYKTILELNNIDRYSIGYYACFDETVGQKNMNDILNNLTEEPNNTAQVSYIYIYVNGTDKLFAPMREVITTRKPSKVVVECRPTTPDIEVILRDAAGNPELYSPKLGYVISKDLLNDLNIFSCLFQGQNDMIEKQLLIKTVDVTPPPMPKISGGYHEFLAGESFSINCTVTFNSRDLVNLAWHYPANVNMASVKVSTNEYIAVGSGVLYKNITIVNATKSHAGLYVCSAINNCDEKEEKFEKTYLNEARLEFDRTNIKPIIETNQKKYKLNVPIDAYPPPRLHLLRNNKILPSNNMKYAVFRHDATGDAIIKITNTTVRDSANYTLVATNGYLTRNVTFDLRILGPPVVNFGAKGDKKYIENTKATLKCDVVGYPLPDITWIFYNGDEEQILVRSEFEVLSAYEMSEYLDIEIHTSGNISCKATNKKGSHIETRRLLVYEIDGGFGIKDRENTWFSQNQDVTLTCIASKYDFSSVIWIGTNGEYPDSNVQLTTNLFSLIAKLKLPNISLNQSGEYICRGVRLDHEVQDESINITIAAIQAPVILKPIEDKTEEVYPTQHLQLNCQAEGIPPPIIEWYKDEVLMKNESIAKIITRTLNHTFVNSTIVIDQMEEKYMGKYECLAKSEGVIAKRTLSVIFKEATYTTYLIVIFAIIFVLIIVVIYLALKIRKEKRLRRAAGLLYFNEGVIKSLNPDLGIDEQAELLPYDKKFEFPPEKLILGKQLGAGAFGVVYKAEARGIINAEETTIVAVKMVKKTADSMYIKALASELKIMVHLGKHINIVNLLGACTKHVGKRELSVIVEYCKFGNIHNYMLRHREVFIDQLTDNKEKNLGRVNRGFSCSGSIGAHSDYFGTSNTQETDHTFINTANTNTSARKVSASGYVQPEWRSNYESDYSYDGRNPRPLTSRDLLAWAFQIARGMEYLASRKVLHGDLAARNVLLADDNIVKICDFGLARSIYKNDEYKKKENSLLPVKWLAIECMTDRIFSTQSDVWSFGIVLWELFSLAKTPYPNISPADLLQWLSEGKRLAKPPYSDDRLYDLMLRCWEQKPTARPSFSQLQEIIGGFLEDNVRNHYVDLNAAYLDMNAASLGHEDYLAMMTAPDYNNLITPSPHHYVNESRSFFPSTPVQLDEEGYLKMNPGSRQPIFSPRPEDSKFDFDARKLNPRVSDASTCGSELTPMLTLNNLPAKSGSESDHEGSASPYITMCPTIDEETDEVFETKQNNARNTIINSAVSNPTYTTIDFDIEKKPNDIINTYTNIPNGLVK